MVYFQRGKSRVPSLKNTVKFILSEPVRSPGRGVFPKELLPGSEGGRRGSWGGSGVRTSCAPCFEFAIFGNFCKRTLHLVLQYSTGRNSASGAKNKTQKFVDTAENEPKEAFLI